MESVVSVPSTKPIQTIDIRENELPDLVGPSLATSGTLKTKKPLKNNEGSFSGVHLYNDCSLVNQHVVIGETLGHNDGLHSYVVTPSVIGDWHSSTGKSAGENAETFFGLESLDFYSQSATAMAIAAGRSPHKVDPSDQGNEFSRPCPVNNDEEGSLVCSGLPTVCVSDARSAEVGSHNPVVSPLDDSAVRISNASLSVTCSEVSMDQDPLTCGEAVVSNSHGGFQIYNKRLEIEEVEAVPQLETLDNLYELTTTSGCRSGKFQPKPKFQIDKEKPGANPSHPDAVESVPCPQQDQLIPSETQYINEGSIPAFSPNHVIDLPSLRFGDSTPALPVNAELTDFKEASCSQASLLGEHVEAVPEIPEMVFLRAKCMKRKTPVSDDSLEHQKASISGKENEPGRSTRQLRKRKNACELVDESEDEKMNSEIEDHQEIWSSERKTCSEP